MKRIAIEFLLTGNIGRSRLQGVFEFLCGRRSWDIRLPQTEADLLRELDAHPDGVIVSHEFSKPTLFRLEKLSVPVVFVDIPRESRQHIRPNDVTIRNDDGGIGILAADYLMSIGSFASFGFRSFREDRYFSRRREEAFSMRLHKEGFKTSVFSGDTESSLILWLQGLAKPAAVFAAWDEGARDILTACQKARIRVPDQLVLLGVDNDELVCTLASPELSSIRLNGEQEGFLSAKELDRLMNAKRTSAKPKSILVKAAGIIERASTKPPPPALHLVRKALAYIEANATKGISPGDVARHLGCSRRLLDLRFHKLQSSTVHAEITRVRLAAVKKSLLTTSLPIRQIACDCGFSSPAVLKNTFRRIFGMSMRDYRKGFQATNRQDSAASQRSEASLVQH